MLRFLILLVILIQMAKTQILMLPHFSDSVFCESDNDENRKQRLKKRGMITLFHLPESQGWGWGRAATLSASSPGT